MNAAEIRALARMLDRVDYYRLLRIEPHTPARQIRRAYQDMRREFHPDTYLAQAEDVRDAVDRIAKRLNEAFAVLRDGARRSAYDHGLGEGQVRFSTETQEQVRSSMEAEKGTTPSGRKFYALAMGDLATGNEAGALKNLKMASTFEPANAHFKAKIEELKAKLGSGESDKLKPAAKKTDNPFKIR